MKSDRTPALRDMEVLDPPLQRLGLTEDEWLQIGAIEKARSVTRLIGDRTVGEVDLPRFGGQVSLKPGELQSGLWAMLIGMAQLASFFSQAAAHGREVYPPTRARNTVPFGAVSARENTSRP